MKIILYTSHLGQVATKHMEVHQPDFETFAQAVKAEPPSSPMLITVEYTGEQGQTKYINRSTSPSQAAELIKLLTPQKRKKS